VIVINCMPDLMRRTRMGKLDFASSADQLTRKFHAESPPPGCPAAEMAKSQRAKARAKQIEPVAPDACLHCQFLDR